MALGGSLLSFVNQLRAQAVAILDSGGNQISSLGDPSRPATANNTRVPQSTTAGTLLAANPARRRIRVTNDDGTKAILFLLFQATGTVSATNYSVRIDSGGEYEGPLNDYTGLITCVWSVAGTGAAQVAEITT